MLFISGQTFFICNSWCSNSQKLVKRFGDSDTSGLPIKFSYLYIMDYGFQWLCGLKLLGSLLHSNKGITVLGRYTVRYKIRNLVL